VLVLVGIDIVLEMNLAVVIHLRINILAHEAADDCNTLLNVRIKFKQTRECSNPDITTSKFRLSTIIGIQLTSICAHNSTCTRPPQQPKFLGNVRNIPQCLRI
jgi:hypothetical protein